jgi:uncharacterized integral membrane protein
VSNGNDLESMHPDWTTSTWQAGGYGSSYCPRMGDDETGERSADQVAASHEATGPDAVTTVGGEGSPVFRGTGVSVALVVGVLIAVLAIVVAVQNTDDVNVDFLGWEVDAPLLAVILTAAVAGVLLDEILGFFWRRRRRRHLADRAELRRLRRS